MQTLSRDTLRGLALLDSLGLLPEAMPRPRPTCAKCGAPMIAGLPGLHRHCPYPPVDTPPSARRPVPLRRRRRAPVGIGRAA